MNYRVRKITPGGTVSTIAGKGCCASVDGAATTVAIIGNPVAVAVDVYGEVCSSS